MQSPIACAAMHACMHAGRPGKVQSYQENATVRRWLIAIAFWLSNGFIKSGLGNRVAYYIVSLFGKTTLGLAYSLVFAEALLAPAIPSVAARAGGIFFPLVKALCLACGSDPVRVCLCARTQMKGLSTHERSVGAAFLRLHEPGAPYIACRCRDGQHGVRRKRMTGNNRLL